MIDDIKSIPVLPRLILQAATVGAIVYGAPAELRMVPDLTLSIERALQLIGGL
ncbi:hypothetical protein [Bradyrhizobium jicamae]|uniref:hypothetical protein n=1 Tax=Bradyrhizobium jicamae TaxID=280332 RepID=UPI00289AB796|nr:hypothetical protein [Bradyrhizobium jicamae]